MIKKNLKTTTISFQTWSISKMNVIKLAILLWDYNPLVLDKNEYWYEKLSVDLLKFFECLDNICIEIDSMNKVSIDL